MTAQAPTILATSGGLRHAPRTHWRFSPLMEFAVELARADAAPKMCFIPTAMGDASEIIRYFYDTAHAAGYQPSHLALFPMPNIEDVRTHLLSQDVIWVGGGSVAGLLAMWQLHGLGDILREAWQAGVVLTGVSAGSICWHVGGPTDSFGPDLRPVTNGLALVPFSNGVHYDSEAQRRPLFQACIADGTLPAGYATDDGVGILYRGTEFVEAVSDVEGKGAYYVSRNSSGEAVEERIEPRLLS
ncbi:Type 1 glutamine amidotransferase-like domain-containing protein [Jatrophihabitans sp. DSM 45814]